MKSSLLLYRSLPLSSFVLYLYLFPAKKQEQVADQTGMK